MYQPLLLTPFALFLLSAAPLAAQVPGLDLANRPAVEGITRATLKDDARLTVTRVQFAPDAAEPVHTHPYDIMVVPLQDGAAELVIGEERKAFLSEGDVQFIPKDVPHQLVNKSGSPFVIIAVAIK